MRELVVIASATMLDLHDAAAFAHAERPSQAGWISKTGPRASETFTDALSWLFTGFQQPAPVHPPEHRLRNLEETLVEAGHAYFCDCVGDRLSALAADALSRGQAPSYDGFCRERRLSRGVSGLRFRSADGSDDFLVRDCLPLAGAMLSGAADRVVVGWGAQRWLRQATRLAQLLGGAAARVVWAPAIVGPDGAPLHRTCGPLGVLDLRLAGLDPEGVRSFLRDAPPGGVAYLGWDELRVKNREAILKMPRAELLRRFGMILAEHRIPDSPGEVERLWAAVRPRIRCLSEAGALLGFLRGHWRALAVAPADRPKLERIAREVGGSRPQSGAALGKVLEGVSGGHRGRLLDLRRVLRRAITGQEIAPPLATVWDLMGADLALERLGRAMQATACADSAPADDGLEV